MTKYEQKNKIYERFIITYNKYKVSYLREKEIFYLFTGYNQNTHAYFWVYDATPEARYALDHYMDERPEAENEQF